VTRRTRRIVRLGAGLLVPHTVWVVMQRLRARRRAAALMGRPRGGPRTTRPFAYEEAVSLLVDRGLDEGLVRFSSIPRDSIAFAGDVIGEHAPSGPLRVLHIGNFVGLSLAALTDIVVAHDPGSVVVSIDPNLAGMAIEDPKNHALALLAEFGLLGSNVVIEGYSMEGTADRAAGQNTLGSLERVGARFDVALVDGSHAIGYVRREVEAVVRLLDDGGLLMLDDVSHRFEQIRELFGELAVDDAWPLEKVDRDGRLGVLRKTAS
jgi:Methyltransferase domain